MYLVDTNIWLERLLDQERAEEVRQFLNCISSDELIITDFTFHSRGVICHRLHQERAFLSFVQDLFYESDILLFSLNPTDMPRVVEVMDICRLDFDDAYQYVASEVCDATLISFDSDFTRTERGSQTPSEILLMNLSPDQGLSEAEETESR